MSEPEHKNTPRQKPRFRPFATTIAAIAAFVLSRQQERDAEREWDKKWRRLEVVGIWVAAGVGVAAIIWSVVSSSGQLSEMRAEQRPWVSAQKISGNGPMDFNSGGITVPLTFEFLNSGHGPAFYVEVALLPQLFSRNMFDPVVQQKNCRRQIRFGVSLFPNQATSLSYTATVTAKDIERENALWPPKAKPPLTIFMLACIRYTDAVTGMEHYTPYILRVGPMAQYGLPGNIQAPIDGEALAKLATAVVNVPLNVIPPT